MKEMEMVVIMNVVAVTHVVLLHHVMFPSDDQLSSGWV